MVGHAAFILAGWPGRPGPCQQPPPSPASGHSSGAAPIALAASIAGAALIGHGGALRGRAIIGLALAPALYAIGDYHGIAIAVGGLIGPLLIITSALSVPRLRDPGRHLSVV